MVQKPGVFRCFLGAHDASIVNEKLSAVSAILKSRRSQNWQNKNYDGVTSGTLIMGADYTPIENQQLTSISSKKWTERRNEVLK